MYLGKQRDLFFHCRIARRPILLSSNTPCTARCWSWKNSTVTKARINFSPPITVQPLYTCICKTLSLSLSRDQTRNTYEGRLSFIPKMFSMKIPTILTCITWHRGTLSLRWRNGVSRRSINCHSIEEIRCVVEESILYDYSSDRVSIDSRPDSPGFVSNYRGVGPRGRVVSNNHGFCGWEGTFWRKDVFKKRGVVWYVWYFVFVNISMFFKKCFFSRSMLRIIKTYYLEWWK